MADEMRKLSGVGKGGKKGGERSESVGNIEDLWKRKREEIEAEEELKKQEKWVSREGKKVQRSPQKEVKMGLEKGEEEKYMWQNIKEEWKRELKIVLREVNEELTEEMRGQGTEIKKELENMKRRLREKEEKEKEEMSGRLKEMERRLEEMKIKEERKTGEREGRGEVEERMKEVERKLEMKEREERRRNVVIRGIKEGKEEIEEEVEGTIKELVVEVDLKGIGGRKEREGGIVFMRMRNLEQKRELIIKKKKMRERGIKIDDMT